MKSDVKSRYMEDRKSVDLMTRKSNFLASTPLKQRLPTVEVLDSILGGEPVRLHTDYSVFDRRNPPKLFYAK